MTHEDKILIPMTLEQHRYYLETYKEIQKLQSELYTSNEQINKLKEEIKIEQIKLQAFKKLNEENFNWLIYIQIEDKTKDWWYSNSFGRASLNHINVNTNINPITYTENLINNILYKQMGISNYSSEYSLYDRDGYEKFLYPIKKIIEDKLVENIERRDKEIKHSLLSNYTILKKKLENIPKWIRKIFKAI